jgi:hypothetical protein
LEAPALLLLAVVRVELDALVPVADPLLADDATTSIGISECFSFRHFQSSQAKPSIQCVSVLNTASSTYSGDSPLSRAFTASLRFSGQFSSTTLSV